MARRVVGRRARACRREATGAVALALMTLALGANGAYAAAPGEFDPTFGTAGVSINQFSPAEKPVSIGIAVAAAPEGKIVVTGQVHDILGNTAVGVARYLSNGQLDPSFGAGGVVIHQFGEAEAPELPSSSPYYSGLAVMPDGRIVIAGFANDKVGKAQTLVARFKANGELDPTFAGGKVIRQLGLGATPESQFYGLALQPDGSVVLAGAGSDPAGRSQFVAERLTPLGEADGTFATAGVFRAQLGISAKAVSVGSDVISVAGGEYVFSVEASDTESSYGFEILKLTAKGVLNAGFGSGGKTFVQPSQHGSTSEAPLRVVEQSTGKFVLAGTAPFDETSYLAFALVRFTASGQLDPTFGNGGTTLNELSSAANPLAEGIGLVVQHDDRLVLPGVAIVNSTLGTGTLTVARYTADGALDPTFASNGVLQRQLGTGETPSTELIGGAIDAAGRLLMTGGAAPDAKAYSWFVGRIILEEPAPAPASPPPSSATPAPAPAPAAFALALTGSTLLMDTHGNLTLRLSANRAASGTVTLTSLSVFPNATPKHKKGKLKLGSATFTLMAGQVRRVKVHLSKRAQSLIRHLGRLRATAAMTATGGGQLKTITATVTIKPAPHKRKR
jgi:uncharacterized delta-60 repeat protein